MEKTQQLTQEGRVEWPGDYLNKIINADCLEVMREMPDKCVDLVLTSPPYDNLRKYNGYCFDFNPVVVELSRVLKCGGIVVWIVGDATVDGSESGTSFRQALGFMEEGFRLHDTMIYAKESWVPLTHNRYEQQFEYMFIFSRGAPKTFNPLRMKSIHAGRSRVMGTFRHTGEKTGRAHSLKPVHCDKLRPNIWFYEVGNMKSSKDPSAFLHPATFPEKLATDHIKSWSNPDETILDPFLGSGTTAIAAAQLGRNFIGIEISPEYCRIAEERLRLEKQQLTLFPNRG